MTSLLTEIESTSTRRKLQARRLEASAPFWGCDDTLFECKPICMKKTGVVTTNLALHTTESPSQVHCASWKHLHEHWSIGADAQSVSDTFVVTTPVFFMQIGLHSKSVSSQPQYGAEAVRRRSSSLRRVAGASIAERSDDMASVDLVSKPVSDVM